MIPVFAQVGEEMIALPDDLDLQLLFGMPVLWCEKVLGNYKVLQCLRGWEDGNTPPIWACDGLLKSLPEDCDRVFEAFPYAFAALLRNFQDLVGNLPDSLCAAHRLCLRMVAKMGNIPRDSPRFMVLAVTYVICRQSNNVEEFLQLASNDEAACFAFFFAVCYGRFDLALRIFLANWNCCLNLLVGGIRLELFRFVGEKDGFGHLLKFTGFCVDRNVPFAGDKRWQAHLKNMVLRCDDNSQIALVAKLRGARE
jgi:hypothetical protein